MCFKYSNTASECDDTCVNTTDTQSIATDIDSRFMGIAAEFNRESETHSCENNKQCASGHCEKVNITDQTGQCERPAYLVRVQKARQLGRMSHYVPDKRPCHANSDCESDKCLLNDATQRYECVGTENDQCVHAGFSKCSDRCEKHCQNMLTDWKIIVRNETYDTNVKQMCLRRCSGWRKWITCYTNGNYTN